MVVVGRKRNALIASIMGYLSGCYDNKENGRVMHGPK